MKLYKKMMCYLSVFLIIFAYGILGWAKSSLAATITVYPGDSYSKIEAAAPGDTVLIAPGTYQFRVNLTKAASAESPITIKAQDPNNRPIFDYTGRTCEQWPGSYNAGDAYRGAWQVRSPAAYYTIDGIIIKGCNGIDQNSGGIRYVSSDHLTIKNCLFQLNENGVIGGGTNTLIESCEFDRNGYSGNDQAHNIYSLGGDQFTMRYCYVHDSKGGQNFHLRAWNNTLEYNWFSNAGSYEGDIQSPGSTYSTPPEDNIQHLLLLGNVFVTNPTPFNGYKIVSLFNNNGVPDLTMELIALWNTFYVSQASSPAAVVQVRNDTLAAATVTFSNNLVAGYGRKFLSLQAPGTPNYNISGSNNWFTTGSTVTPLTDTIFASDPGFTDAPTDLTLQASSSAIGAANDSVSPQPAYSVTGPSSATARNQVTDVGAFQYSSSAETSKPSPPSNLRLSDTAD